MLNIELTYSQEKYEKEIRLKSDEVAQSLKQKFSSIYGDDIKAKWYRESNLEEVSFEAKFKYNNYYHSVEFDSLGNVEDIEIAIAYNSLEKDIKSNIDTYFNSNYLKHKIIKVQKQYSGSIETLKEAAVKGVEDEVVVKYEIEFYGKTDNTKELWEGLFNQSGQFLHKRKIVLRPTDNLNF
jgi:hypothetical protein